MKLGVETGSGLSRDAAEVQRLAPIEVLVGSERFPIVFARCVGGFIAGLGVIGFVALALPLPTIPGFQPFGVAVFMALAVALGLGTLLFPSLFDPRVLRRMVALFGALGIIPLLHFLGPRIEVGIVPIAVGAATAPFWVGRLWAGLFVGMMTIGYSVEMASTSGFPGPASRGLIVIGTVVLAAGFLDWLIGLIRNLATNERTIHRELQEAHTELAAAHGQLADLNQNLEARVAAQVAEIEALNRLRRFLSPQVAEAVLSEGDEALLQPHRRQIAVFFCDLRGFTSFASGAEPEDVVEALDDYYNVVGAVLRRHEATVGAFAGDGIMAYLNDPVPCQDPGGTAVQMAQELREPMAALVERWKRKGFNLGYGVGIAYGYATLGTIGFEGRNDYTALGSVVNLAARLCGEAAPGEVLIDSRTADALGDRLTVAEREVTLKGFPTPINAFQVVG